MTGLQLRKMICAELPSKPGSRISVQHGSSPLRLDLTLRQGSLANASPCPMSTVDMLAAWKYLDGEQVEDEEFSLHGLTRIEGIHSAWQLQDLPSSLQHLELADRFNESLARVKFPGGIKTIIFGWNFNQSLDEVTLPAGLQTLTLGDHFNESLADVTLPAGLQTVTFGNNFHQCLDEVTLPAGLQTLTLGDHFNESLADVTLPAGLQTVTFGNFFVQRRDREDGVWVPARQGLFLSKADAKGKHCWDGWVLECWFGCMRYGCRDAFHKDNASNETTWSAASLHRYLLN